MTSLLIICAELSPLTGNSGPVVLEILQMYFFGEDIISVPMFSFSGAPFISKLNRLYQSSTFLTFFSPFSNLWLIGSSILSDLERVSQLHHSVFLFGFFSRVALFVGFCHRW